jgi:hypothetical protein
MTSLLVMYGAAASSPIRGKRAVAITNVGLPSHGRIRPWMIQVTVINARVTGEEGKISRGEECIQSHTVCAI